MKKLIVGNWKMNPASHKEAKQLFDGVKKGVKNAKADIVICPPFVYLAGFKIQDSGFKLGAQDVFYKEKGAFTGEISPAMLKDLGVEYVIIGHSERRTYFGETDEAVNKKIKSALEYKLTPILCVGEKEGEDKNQVLEKQLTEGLKALSRDEVKRIVIAYEPIWAISKGDGRGKSCSVDETMRSALLVKKIISQLYNRDAADSMKVLYGGSANPENAAAYIQEGGVDGLLVGGASLDAEQFATIAKAAG